MTRITTLAHLAAAKEPPPSSVWAMTISVLGVVFGAPSARRLLGVNIDQGRGRPVR